MTLITTPLTSALANLTAYSAAAHKALAAQDTPGFELARAASIQAFEYSYELCLKLLHRKLASQTANLPIAAEDFERISFNELVRLGAEAGYLNKPEHWPNYRLQRNKAAHTYQPRVAEDVWQTIPAFLADATYLLTKLGA